MANFTIEKNIISYLQEQVDILAKEYEYIILIANFYSGTKKNTTCTKSQKADLEKNFNSIKEIIRKEHNTLINIYNDINNLLLHPTTKQKEDIVYVFITIDYIKKRINKLTNKFEKINEKLIQMLRDGYNQYIPKPIIGKRHSNINIISQLELKINQSKNINPNKEFFITWKFSHSYQVLSLGTDKTMINLSYWIFDTPYLMPTITHEIIHKRIEEFSPLTKILSNILDKNEYMKLTNRKKIFKYQNNNSARQSILEDIAIDIVSFLKHGNSYILTLATVHLGYHFASTFKRNDSNGSFDIAPWEFNQKRDISMLRLFILVNFIENNQIIKKLKNHKKFEQNSQEVKEISNIMNKLYFEEGIGFKEIYTNYHNYQEEYELIMSLIKSFTTDILSSIDFINEIKIIFFKEFNSKTSSDKLKNLPETFNDIWEHRLDNQFIQNTTKLEYRKKVHNKTIKKLIDNKYLSSLDILKTYQITFVKTKLPKTKDENFNYLDFSSVQDHNTYYNTLGIYDFIKINSPSRRNYSERNMLEEIYKKKQHYKSFISLMKIMDDILGDNKTKEFNAVIQIEVEKNLSAENIHDTYDRLFEDLEKIREIFSDNRNIEKNKYKKVEFFKSLGPKDIVVIIYNCSIRTIYEIKRAIGKESSLKRSYSTIFYDKLNSENLNINHEYTLSTEIRAHNTNEGDTNNIEDYLQKDEFKNSTIYKVAGVMDYEIVWNESMQLSNINTIYTKLIQEGLIQDLQTMISKKLLPKK